MAQVDRVAYTLQGVADLVGGLSVKTVRRWSDRGELKVSRIAGRPMVFKEDLDAFLSKCGRREAA